MPRNSDLTDLQRQAISRAKLLVQIYYSHSRDTIKILHQKIDEIVDSVMSRYPEDEENTRVISSLAEFFAHSPLGRLSIQDTSERIYFFKDLLFERYNSEVIRRYVSSYS